MNKKLLILLMPLLITSCKKQEVIVAKTYTIEGEFIDNEYVFPMNTISTLTFYNDDDISNTKDTLTNMIQTVSHYFDRYHNYDTIKNLKTLNETGIIENADYELYNLIDNAIKIGKLTKGKFNIFIGSLIDELSDYIESGNNLPDETTISSIVSSIPPYTSFDDVIELDYDTFTIKLNEYKGIWPIISVGGIGKGYIGDKVVKYLQINNYHSIVNLGSSTIGLVNSNPKNESGNYNISFRLPNNENDYSCIISLPKDYNISTSADNIYAYNNGNPWISHILNPLTGYSNSTYRSVSLISSNASLTLLDALSTAIFNCADDTETKDLIINIENEYNVSIDYMLLKPYINESSNIELTKYNVSYSKHFKELMSSDFNENIINKEEL